MTMVFFTAFAIPGMTLALLGGAHIDLARRRPACSGFTPSSNGGSVSGGETTPAALAHREATAGAGEPFTATPSTCS